MAREQLLLDTLERLLELSGAELSVALADASDLVAAALRADKVDIFMYDASRDSLVALGSSHQPMSAQQKRHGLDVLPVSIGGRTAHVFRTAETWVDGNVDQDPEELRGVKELLGVRSSLGVPLYVGAQLRGVLLIASAQPHFWDEQDAAFMHSVARWIGVLTQRTELVQDASRTAVEQGRLEVADELVTVLAHDLRNYLAPLDLRLRVVRRRAEREQRGADVSDLDTTLKGLARLGTLIGDLLDVARVDQGVFSIDVQPLPLLALLEDTAATLETPEHAILVEAASEVVALADPSRIRQCIENLLANAIKHSPRHGKVRVVLSQKEEETRSCAVVEVIDEGLGVPEHLLSTLFERYAKGARSVGLGLGLYLAKRIAVLHGGELSVESKAGTGARFVLSLPLGTE